MKSGKTELSQKTISKIESLCENGCTQINKLLDQANEGNEIEELAGFNKDEINQIIVELREVMSVYSDNNTSL